MPSTLQRDERHSSLFIYVRKRHWCVSHNPMRANMKTKMKMDDVTLLSIFVSIAFMAGKLNALRMNKKLSKDKDTAPTIRIKIRNRSQPWWDSHPLMDQ